MTRSEIVTVVIRMLATWLIIQGFTVILYTGLTPVLAGNWSSSVTAIVMFLVMGLIGALTWNLAPTLAHRLLPVRDPDETILPWSKSDVQEVLFQTLGLYLIVTSIGSLAAAVAAASTASGDPGSTANLIRFAVQLLGGVFLVIGAPGVRRAVEMVRHGGDYVADEEQKAGDSNDGATP